MDKLESIGEQLNQPNFSQASQQWNPPLCGDIDIVINGNGDWYHEGGKIQRHSLVKLFFSVLRRDTDGQYYLVTPVEKWRIRVDDAVCIAVSMTAQYANTEQQRVVFTTNIDEQVVLSSNNPLTIVHNELTDTPVPYVALARGLTAKLSRSVYYQLVDIGVQDQGKLKVLSDGQWFSLGAL